MQSLQNPPTPTEKGKKREKNKRGRNRKGERGELMAGSTNESEEFYLRYYVGHKGKFGHEFLEFEFRPDGKLRYANNSNYKNDTMIRKEVFVSPSVLRECRRIITESEVETLIFNPTSFLSVFLGFFFYLGFLHFISECIVDLSSLIN